MDEPQGRPPSRAQPEPTAPTDDRQRIEARRRLNWAQTPATRLRSSEQAARLIDRLGLATLFPVSPEVPNLFHAYTGDPLARTDSGHSSPSGQVYGWRWSLGRAEAAFYGAVVRGRPTWVAWSLLSAVLRLRGETRAPEALHERGELSADALRVARALAAAGGVLATGELRAAAGFPTGKPERAAYLRAVQELDDRLLLAKVFARTDDEMRHALVRSRYPEAVAAAEAMTPAAALDALLAAYFPAAVYAVPAVLARHLKLPEGQLRAGCERLVDAGRAESVALPGQRGTCYVWVA